MNIDYKSYYYKYKALKYYLKNNKIKGGTHGFKLPDSEYIEEFKQLLEISNSNSTYDFSLPSVANVFEKYLKNKINKELIAQDKIYIFFTSIGNGISELFLIYLLYKYYKDFSKNFIIILYDPYIDKKIIDNINGLLNSIIDNIQNNKFC